MRGCVKSILKSLREGLQDTFHTASHSHHWFIEMADAVAPCPASAGAHSALPRQGGAAALPSSAAPPDYAASIPTSGLRQIPARSPSRYPLDDADAPHQYRRGS